MKTLWIWISSFVAVIAIGVILLYLSIVIAAWIFIPSYDKQPTTEDMFYETSITDFELKAIEEAKTKEHLKQYERFWNEHKDCDYWKGKE